MPCHPTEFYSLTGAVVAANFSAPPNLLLIPDATAQLSWPVDYELLGITMTSTLTNFGTAIMGVFLMINQNQPKITYATATPAPIAAVTGQNSLVGPPAVPIPSDKTIAKVFLQPPIIKAGQLIALYAFGDTTAGNSLAAFVSLDVRMHKK